MEIVKVYHAKWS